MGSRTTIPGRAVDFSDSGHFFFFFLPLSSTCADVRALVLLYVKCSSYTSHATDIMVEIDPKNDFDSTSSLWLPPATPRPLSNSPFFGRRTPQLGWTHHRANRRTNRLLFSAHIGRITMVRWMLKSLACIALNKSD